jgi:hypothetical protein
MPAPTPPPISTEAPPATSTPTPRPRATATPLPQPTATATTVATRTSTATADGGGLAEYVDPSGDFAVGYPADWSRLTEDQIRERVGIDDERAAESTLENIAFVVASPDGRAIVSVTRTRLPAAEDGALEEVVRAVREANAASVAGIDDVAEEAIVLDGVDAVRLTYTADDPATGASGGRLIRQVVTTVDDDAIVLTFVVRADEAESFESTFRRMEESWQWRS